MGRMGSVGRTKKDGNLGSIARMKSAEFMGRIKMMGRIVVGRPPVL